ncbi:MAG: DNA repair protein RadC [Clostridia bacterium]|nr:DNA repair protein RadC [Clostridia bacterium]
MGNIHDGHRARMRDRIVQSGLASMQYHEILEYVLYPFVPMKDTNEIAHNLMSRFGSFANVLNADYEQLMSVSGVTQSAAIFISSVPDLCRKYQESFNDTKVSLKGRKEIREYLKSFFLCRPKEAVCVATLDVHNKLIGVFEIAEGWADSVNCAAREVVDVALRTNACSVVVAHNHPSGVAVPSDADYLLTNAIACALELIGINFFDHIIFAKEEIFSFEANGLFEQYSKNLKNMLKDGSRFYESSGSDNE